MATPSSHDTKAKPTWAKTHVGHRNAIALQTRSNADHGARPQNISRPKPTQRPRNERRRHKAAAAPSNTPKRPTPAPRPQQRPNCSQLLFPSPNQRGYACRPRPMGSHAGNLAGMWQRLLALQRLA